MKSALANMLVRDGLICTDEDYTYTSVDKTYKVYKYKWKYMVNDKGWSYWSIYFYSDWTKKTIQEFEDQLFNEEYESAIVTCIDEKIQKDVE